MNQSLHEYVLEQLQHSKGRWPEVSKRSGVALRTLEKIARRETKDPGVSLIEKLANYFREQQAA
jgi:hypothetical protein